MRMLVRQEKAAPVAEGGLSSFVQCIKCSLLAFAAWLRFVMASCVVQQMQHVAGVFRVFVEVPHATALLADHQPLARLTWCCLDRKILTDRRHHVRFHFTSPLFKQPVVRRVSVANGSILPQVNSDFFPARKHQWVSGNFRPGSLKKIILKLATIYFCGGSRYAAHAPCDEATTLRRAAALMW